MESTATKSTCNVLEKEKSMLRKLYKVNYFEGLGFVPKKLPFLRSLPSACKRKYDKKKRKRRKCTNSRDNATVQFVIFQRRRHYPIHRPFDRSYRSNS